MKRWAQNWAEGRLSRTGVSVEAKLSCGDLLTEVRTSLCALRTTRPEMRAAPGREHKRRQHKNSLGELSCETISALNGVLHIACEIYMSDSMKEPVFQNHIAGPCSLHLTQSF